MPVRQTGRMLQADYFINTGGLNNTDSPFAVREDQATDGRNWDYVRTGGIRKRLGHQKVNSSADAQLKTLGIGLHNTTTGTKTVVRAAGTKIQSVNLTSAIFTNMTEDTTAASSEFLTSGSNQRVVKSQFNTTLANVLWLAGGGMTLPKGVYSASKVTENGSVTPTGSLGTSVASGSGVFSTTGTAYYAVSYRKLSTQNEGNVALDKSATISATTDEVTLDLTGLTNLDTTKYDKIYIYRSSVGGVEGFTTGDLIAQLDSTETSYVDTGADIVTASTNIPRAGNTVLDQSPLPSGTYNVLTTFKRRLVTSKDSTIRLSDLNKPEAWPTVNTITVPSGGNITGLAVISNSSTTGAVVDEFLVIFKERELWVLTGNDIEDWSLQFIDNVGCPAQSLIATANGYIGWMDSRGIYLWNGASKPIYTSRPIEDYFEKDGDLDLSKIERGYAAFFRKSSQIIWVVSNKFYGENKFAIKLDLRLTLPAVTRDIAGNVMEGVFTADSMSEIDAIEAMVPTGEKEEALIGGDNAGFLYRMYNAHSDGGAGIDFQYDTTFLMQGTPSQTKRYHKVIVWVEELGTWDLTLDYWSNYRVADEAKSTRAQPISKDLENDISLWDVAFWDTADWDDYLPKQSPIVFNLDSNRGNAEGDAIKLRLRNSGADQPVTISGFSILYTELPTRK